MKRIDTFLVEHQFVESREQAKRLILAGLVTVNGDSRIKPGHRVPTDAKVVVQAQQKYVSRGGFKLQKALGTFGVDVRNRVALDVGASTGGFTDCLLQHGARFVYAVDVGYGQLAWKLRTHPQVMPIEKTNIRHLTPSHLEAAPMRVENNFISIAVIDVSFISLRTVLPSVATLLTQQRSRRRTGIGFCQQEKETAGAQGLHSTHPESQLFPIGENRLDIIALLKPQFEAGKAFVKKGGVVSDKQVHIRTINTLSAFVNQKLNATVRGLIDSPIHRDIANIEYLLWITLDSNVHGGAPGQGRLSEQAIADIVAAAHETRKRECDK